MKTYEQIIEGLDKCEQVKDLNERLKQKRFTKLDLNSDTVMVPHEDTDFNDLSDEEKNIVRAAWGAKPESVSSRSIDELIEKFTAKYGGKVFYIISITEGKNKIIHNPEVIEEIKKEIEKLGKK